MSVHETNLENMTDAIKHLNSLQQLLKAMSGNRLMNGGMLIRITHVLSPLNAILEEELERITNMDT